MTTQREQPLSVHEPVREPRLAGLYPVVSRALAVLLIAAAALKGFDLATVSAAGSALLGSRPLTVAWINLEALLAVWLLFSLYPRPTRTAAMILFSVFACFAFVKGISGATDCGCFGRLRTNPWVIFTIDLLAVLALALNPPRAGDTTRVAPRLLAFSVSGLLLVTAITAVLVVNRPPPPPALVPTTIPDHETVDPVWN